MNRLAKVVLLLAVFAVQAAYAFEVKEMRVDGLRRISDGTVYNYLPVNIGDELDGRRVAEALRTLYSTGLFDDVELRREGGTLVIVVRERPTINRLTITGNKQVKEEEMLSGLRDAGLAEGREFDRSVLDRMHQELNRLYFSHGRYAVDIETDTTEVPNNKVDLAITISEGETAKIRQINLVGNSLYDDKELLEEFELKKPNLLCFYKKNCLYSQQKLNGDLESLRSFYMDRGYANFDIDSTQVTISPDKRDIYLTVNIDEGQVYKVSDVTLGGDLVVPEESLMWLVLIKPETTFSRKKVTDTVELLSRRLGQEGYAFAEVTPIPEFDEENKQVAITFIVQPKNRAYVRRIRFNGVENTNDEVFRREMRVLEGGWLSNVLLDRSKLRLARLPFVEDVQVETTQVPGSPDLVDVDFQIKQRQSGTLSAGLGFSDRQGLIVNGGFTEANFLGGGNRLAVNLNAGSFSQLYNISHTDPYFTEDGISRSISGSFAKTDQLVSNASSFTSNVLSGSALFGIPITEFSSISLGVALRDTELLASDFSPQEYTNWVRDNGDTFFRGGNFLDNQGNNIPIPGSAFNTWELLLGWTRDTRNRSIFPDRGSRQNFSIEWAGPGSDVEYYTARYRFSKYWRIAGPWTVAWKGDFGWAAPLGDTLNVPPGKNFFAGGAQSVRGFRNNTLSPLDSFGNPFGGDLLVVNQFELLLPTPERFRGSARGALFLDIGNAFYLGDQRLFQPRDQFGVPTGAAPAFNPEFWDFQEERLRYSAGVSVTWLAPLGAIQISYAVPLNEIAGTTGRPADETEQFQFSINSPF